MLNSFRNFWRIRAPTDALRPMWIDAPGSNERLQSFRSVRLKVALSELIRDGFTVLKRNSPAELCDRVVNDFGRYCAQHPEHQDFCDGNRLHDRLANLHLWSDSAKELALEESVLEIVEAAFESPASLVGSLYFERGSEQDIHRDTPSFYTIPLNHYFGVWHALEDVSPDAGALTYYAGGHRLAPDSEFIGSGIENMDAYFRSVVAACEAGGVKRKTFFAEKGDTLIWHPQLPHGGSPIANPSRSRRSIVFHYKPNDAPIYGPREFFGPQHSLPSRRGQAYLPLGKERRCLDHGKPQFFRNKKEGNFQEF